MKAFEPDYRNLLDAAYNKEAKRLPLYEHIVSPKVMEQLTGNPFAELENGNDQDLEEFFRQYCEFFREHGYDTVSYERCIGKIMPGSGALGDSRVDPVIKDRADFERYPWEELPALYFQENARYFKALRRQMPAGMRAVGGAGNGIFECVQDLVGFQNLCYLQVDDPELYDELFQTVGQVNLKIWQRLLREYGDVFCVLRFGDDLGFKSTTLLSAQEVRRVIIPQYVPIIAEVHSYHKPFLLHSCGCIFEVMEDLMAAGINAKHSNEDQIAPFPVWVERYGDRIGNFGGIDTDAVCRLSEPALREYITEVIAKCKGHGGFAFGSGNSIPDYVPADNYQRMTEIVRACRGE